MQSKLAIGESGDKYEQEADRVAERVMRMPAPQVEENAENGTLQTTDAPGPTPGVTPRIAAKINAIRRAGGRPLPEATRDFFEPRFGHDFSRVRVHTDVRAADTAGSVNARAFTTGQDIVFGEGLYAPVSTEGQRLLAHELTHVMQQTSHNRGRPPRMQVQRKARKKLRIDKIDVDFQSKKTIGRFPWWAGKSYLKRAFPGLKKRSDFTFDVGTAKAFFNNGAALLFAVSGGISGKSRYKTPRTSGRYRSIFRKEKASYISSKGDPMPHASYYYRGYAFHGCGVRNNFLANLWLSHNCLEVPSHGCIHVKNSWMGALHPFIRKNYTKVKVK